MTAADPRPDRADSAGPIPKFAAPSEPPSAPSERPSPVLNGRRALLGGVVVALVVVGAAWAIYKERHDFVHALRTVGVVTMLVSFLIGLIAVAANYPAWRAVMRGLEVQLPLAAGARVFFVSQLGKYVPGSVWPVLMQMEAGRRYGAARRTMITGNLLTLLLSCTLQLLVAALVLPFANAHALSRYWWLLLALPFLLALLHPRAVPWLLDRLFGLIKRAPLGERLPLRASVRAGGWTVFAAVALGLHVAVLALALGGGSVSVALAIGGMGLAVSAGVLFIPAPAGAGIRDAVLVLVLSPELGAGQALAVAVASRVLLVLVDVVLAALAFGLRGRTV